MNPEATKKLIGELVYIAVDSLHRGQIDKAETYWSHAVALVKELMEYEQRQRADQRRVEDTQRRIARAVAELKKLGAFEILFAGENQ
jgi:hypothetical protein